MQSISLQVRILTSLVLLGVLIACGNGRGIGPTAQDAEEAEAIYQAFLETYQEDDNNETFAVGVYTAGNYSRITVYGVVDTADQDQIVEILTNIKHDQATRPMRVNFYEREILETRQFEDGSSAEWHGDEVLLREETIE